MHKKTGTKKNLAPVYSSCVKTHYKDTTFFAMETSYNSYNSTHYPLMQATVIKI